MGNSIFCACEIEMPLSPNSKASLVFHVEQELRKLLCQLLLSGQLLLTNAISVEERYVEILDAQLAPIWEEISPDSVSDSTTG